MEKKCSFRGPQSWEIPQNGGSNRRIIEKMLAEIPLPPLSTGPWYWWVLGSPKAAYCMAYPIPSDIIDIKHPHAPILWFQISTKMCYIFYETIVSEGC